MLVGVGCYFNGSAAFVLSRGYAKESVCCIVEEHPGGKGVSPCFFNLSTHNTESPDLRSITL